MNEGDAQISGYQGSGNYLFLSIYDDLARIGSENTHLRRSLE